MKMAFAIPVLKDTILLVRQTNASLVLNRTPRIIMEVQMPQIVTVCRLTMYTKIGSQTFYTGELKYIQ